MVSQWNLNDSKSPYFSRTLHSILADLNKALVCIVSTRPLISKFSSLCINPLVTVLRALITIGITVTFMFRSFYNPLARSRYLSFFSLSFNFTLWSAGTGKTILLQVLFFVGYCLVWSSGRDLLIRLNVKIPGEFVFHFSRMDSGLCIYHLVIWLNSNFLHNSQ